MNIEDRVQAFFGITLMILALFGDAIIHWLS